MKHQIHIILGVLAAITGLASSAQAQSTVAANSGTGNYTLSGESLITVESRTVQSDFSPFFLGINPGTSANNTVENNNLTPQAEKNDSLPQGLNNDLIPPEEGVVLAVTDDAILFPNEPPAFMNNRVPFGRIEGLEGNDRVQVRIGLDEDR